RQPLEITVRTCDVTVRASGDMDNDVSTLCHLISVTTSCIKEVPRSRGPARRREFVRYPRRAADSGKNISPRQSRSGAAYESKEIRPPRRRECPQTSCG